MSTTPNLYVECRRCDECDHIGINDSHATDAACSSCAWSGPSPEQDKCPECGANGTMSTACPKCSGLYAFLADAHLPQAQQPAPAQPAVAQSLARLNAQIQWLRHGTLWDAAPMMAVTDMEVLRDAFAALDAAAAAPDGEAFERGRQQGLSQERALWELARSSQEMAPAEPVVWIGSEDLKDRTYLPVVYLGAKPPEWPHDHGYYDVPLYAAAAAVQPPVVPLTAARIEQLAITAGLYSGNPRTPGTGSIVLRRLRRFAELIEQDRGIGAVPPPKP